MPYQLPTLQRTDQAPSPSVGRIEANAPNITGAVDLQNKATEQLASSAVDVYSNFELSQRDQELTAMDVKATALSNSYETAYKTKLAEIGKMSGDPTDAYKDLEDKKSQWKQKLGEDAKSSPEEVQILLNHKLGLTDGRLMQNQTVQQSTQNFVYAQHVNRETVKLRQDSMMDVAQTLDIKNPDSLMTFKAYVQSIEDLNQKNAAANGLAKKSIQADGSVRYDLSPAALNQTKADVGEGVVNVVKVLNNSGRVKEAKYLINEYGDYLNAKDKEKVLADNSDANVKNLALDAVSKLKNQSGRAAMDEIKNNKDLSEAVKYKANEIIDTNDRRNEYASKRKADDTYQVTYGLVKDKMTSPAPYLTTAQMYDDPRMREATKYLTPNQRKALEEMVVAPKESDPKAKELMQQTVLDGKLVGMKPQEFNRLQVGLSKEDRSRYEPMYYLANKKDKHGATEGELSSRVTRMTNQLFKEAQISGALPASGAPSSWNSNDHQRYLKLMDGFMDYYSKNVKNEIKDPIAQKAMVRDYLVDFETNNANPKPGGLLGFFGVGGRKMNIPERLGYKSSSTSQTTDVPSDTTTIAKGAVNVSSLSTNDRKVWVNKFVDANGRPANNLKELQDFANSQVSK